MLKNELKSCYKFKQLNFKRFLRTNHINLEILSDIFGLPKHSAKHFVEQNKLADRDGDQIINSIRLCRKLGYTNDEILGTPKLLRFHPLALEQHYLTLEEGGFHPISPKVLARARTHMRKPINVLKSEKIIPEELNVAENFSSYIENKEIVNQMDISYFTDFNQWSNVHKSLLESFLRIRLSATEDEIITLFRIHKSIHNKSFRIIQENIAIAENLGFETRKLLKYGYLLHNYPDYPKTVLKDFPNLAGTDMRKAMRVSPKLIMASPTNILKIYGLLKKYEIQDEAIRKQMNVFQMSPETVRLRLEEIERSPDFKVLLNHPNVLSLIVHHNRAKSRLSYLQQLQLRCASLVILGSNLDNLFEQYVKEGKDVNKPNDVIIFVAKLLNGNIELVKKQLKRHPFYLQVPLKDMKTTYDYLITQGFHSKDILKALYILLYPRERIAKAINEITANKEVDLRCLSKPNRLNLILYFIEKEYHFTGNGIWRNVDIETEFPMD